jgi:hypothetical protein
MEAFKTSIHGVRFEMELLLLFMREKEERV